MFRSVTDFMERNPSWKASSCSDSQESPVMLRTLNPKAHHCVHESPFVVLSHMNPFPTSILMFIHLCLVFQMFSFLQVSWLKLCIEFFSLMHDTCPTPEYYGQFGCLLLICGVSLMCRAISTFSFSVLLSCRRISGMWGFRMEDHSWK
jgi:hypothetical protein